MEYCVICAEPVVNDGHNPWPFGDDGGACDDCHAHVVKPARLAIASGRSPGGIVEDFWNGRGDTQQSICNRFQGGESLSSLAVAFDFRAETLEEVLRNKLNDADQLITAYMDCPEVQAILQEKCIICNGLATGRHNPWPFGGEDGMHEDGVCCDKCNEMVVKPSRLAMASGETRQQVWASYKGS